MSFLSNLFQMNSNVGTVNTQGNGNINISAPVHLDSAAAAKLLSLTPGQTVQGEVVSMQGEQVQLLLGNELLLNASLESKAGIDIGQLVSFQVKGNSGSLLSLIPLSVNLTSDENVMKALQEASLPITEKTVELVKTLMKEGMPIDKESLLLMNKESNAFPKTTAETIVQMARLNIPITEESIQQFEAYKNAEHKLSEGISEMTTNLSKLFANTENTQKGMEFLRQMLEFFAGEGKEGVMLKGQDIGITGPATGENGVGNGAEIEPGISEGTQSGDVQKSNIQNTDMQNIAAQNAGISEESIQNGTEAKSLETVHVAEGETVLSSALEELSPKERESLFQTLKQAGVDTKMQQSLQNGQLSVKDLVEHLQQSELSDGQLRTLFSSKSFGKLLLNDMKNQLLLQPEQVSRDNMEEYYSNLKTQITKLMQVLESTGRGESSAAKTAQNLNQNVDFMNQMNQTYTYVQIPLKMMKDTAHGELYVYTNKRNLAKKDGSVSALLHLDMRHIGTLDVYVAMQQERVSTKFYLQDEATIAFLEGHMGLLTERLTKKGYHTSTEVVLRKEAAAKNVMEEILQQEKNVPEMTMIGTRSFDVKA